MSAGEFAFLAIGLLLGVASGAALMEVIRSRPPAPREVRLTLTPDSVPRRPATLAVSPFVTEADGPARGGPGDRRLADRDPLGTVPGGAADAAVVGATHSGPDGAPATAAAGASLLRPATISRARVAIPIEPEPDPFMEQIRASTLPTAVLVGVGAVATADRDESAAGSGPLPRSGWAGGDPAAGSVSGAGGDPAPTGPTGQPQAEQRSYSGPCGNERRLVDERCEIAERARMRAVEAADRLRAAQRAYDEHVARAEAAEAAADPRAVQRAKDEAQAAFQASSAAAMTPADAETAASAWLAEINRINATARSAATQLQRSREATTSLVVEFERLQTEADAARIGAESAAEACLQAREVLARCEEADALRRDGGDVAPPAAESRGETLVTGRVLAEVDLPAEAPLSLPATADGGGPDETAHDPEADPAILRILRGDHAALARVADRLAGGDPAERGRWQLLLDQLVDAVAARAIEESLLDMPDDHPFWGMFTGQQAREIVAALASLGYRFDGLGGFADARVPSQRDLSLAVGYAGLDPMRIRRWPNEAEMVDLFDGTRVAGDEYLLGTAPGLTLGELVTSLGRRADELAELWNAWGQVRPVLLARA